MLTALAGGSTDLNHTLVILEEGAEATLLAETAGDDCSGSALRGHRVAGRSRGQAALCEPATMGIGRLALCSSKGPGRSRRPLQWTIGALGSRLAKVNQHVALVGERAEAQVNGVMFTEGKQHLSYHTLQHHQAPNCTSDLLYKGAMQDQSRIVWRGMIKVDKDAQKTDGYQRNDNLMLSEAARADSIPGLEIEADDVRCTHGSTAGRVDEEPDLLHPLPRADAQGSDPHDRGRFLPAGLRPHHHRERPRSLGRSYRPPHRNTMRDGDGVTTSFGLVTHHSSLSPMFTRVAKVSDIPDPGKQAGRSRRSAARRLSRGRQVLRHRRRLHARRRAAGRRLPGRLPVACPRHGAKFDIRDGRALTMPATMPRVPTKLKSKATTCLVK